MAVSVRMEPLLEQELERAARQLGVSKSQFIIDAVESALGRKDAFALLQRAQRKYGLDTGPAHHGSVQEPGPGDAPLRERLRDKLQVKHDAEMRDWLAYQEARRLGQAWHPDGAAGTPP